MTKHDTQSIKVERYRKLESKPAWRAVKLMVIAILVLASLFSAAGLWSEVNGCYERSDAHDRWAPSDAGNFYRGAQPNVMHKRRQKQGLS